MAKSGRKPAGAREMVTGLTFDRERVAPPLAENAGDLDALRTSVVDAAGVSGALWLSYLFVLFYFLVATGGVTNKDLFLRNPVRLPFLNVDLPLQGFFWLGPLIFLIVHIYVLLHFVVLAGKVRAFDAALVDQVTAFDARASLRRQLPTNIFVQFLAGPREIRLGIPGAMLWLVAMVSLVVGPVAVLLFFELQFLPFHAEWMTWLQRVTVAADLALLWVLWPKIVSRDSGDRENGVRRRAVTGRPRWVWLVLLVCMTAAVGALIPLVTTFPGESLDATARGVRLRIAGRDVPGLIRTWLVEGIIDPASRRPGSPFANRLVLPGLDLTDYAKQAGDEKTEASPISMSLRGRDLRSAVLTGAVLRKVDFTAADLREARLESADLRGAKFDCAYLFDRGSGNHARCARLAGARLNDASLQGASLVGASLQGAYLDSALLQGASMSRASLQGASLVRASLQGARLDAASLDGASLVMASLQGALLEAASLRGASLFRASLLGASLDWAYLQGASLEEAFVWRADPRTAHMENANLDGINITMKTPCPDDPLNTCPWTAGSFRALHDAIANQVPKNPGRERALAQVDPILDPDKGFTGETDIAARWLKLKAAAVPSDPAVMAYLRSLPGRQYRPITQQDVASVQPGAIEAAREKQWLNAGCAADGAPYVVAGLASRFDVSFAETSNISALATAFLDPGCEGARGISPETAAQLRRWAYPAAANRP